MKTRPSGFVFNHPGIVDDEFFDFMTGLLSPEAWMSGWKGDFYLGSPHTAEIMKLAAVARGKYPQASIRLVGK